MHPWTYPPMDLYAHGPIRPWTGSRRSRAALPSQPGPRNVELLEERDGVPVGHAGDEVAPGGVEAFLLDRRRVQVNLRPLADLFPQAGEDAVRLLEFLGGDLVLVDRPKKKFAKPQRRVEHFG